MENRIKNFAELATTPNRRLALELAEAGLRAIDTEEAVQRAVSLSGNTLKILGESYDLSKFKSIKVVGFGKASCAAASALEKILGSRITEGAVVGLERTPTQIIQNFVGTHPKPSAQNVAAGRKIFEIVKNSSAEDLVIALVSGGGSSLLCSSEQEREQGTKLYEAFLKTGKTIAELNTVRKHLSIFKGGGLAKIAYPATIVGLIFSDVPGDNFLDVASGPTYKDNTTVEDAERIIAENNLGQFELIRTPKDDKYFAKVKNFILVSNKTASDAMRDKALELGLESEILSTELYDDAKAAVEKMFSAKRENSAVIAAGEPKLKVPARHGRGGRNTHLALAALNSQEFDPGAVFIALASDGLDNSDAAGAIVDYQTAEKIKSMSLDSEVYENGFNSYDFFKKTGDMIITGPTGANVADLMVLLYRAP